MLAITLTLMRTQILWSRGLSGYGIGGPPHEVDEGLKIRPVLLGEFAYCAKCGKRTYLACQDQRHLFVVTR